ncbi:Nac domain-containing protein, partial [Thalictrum thalictroides]
MSQFNIPSSGNFVVVPRKDGDILLAKGFIFTPKEEELVDQYLKKKAYCQDLPCEIIKPIDDLYKMNSDQIPMRDFVYGKTNEAFFFTDNHTRYLEDNQTFCPTSGGYWQVTDTNKQVLDRNNNIIGYKDRLIFFGGKYPNGQISNYAIEEFRLNSQQNATLDLNIRNN